MMMHAGAFPEAWEEGVGDVGRDDDPLPAEMLAPANPNRRRRRPAAERAQERSAGLASLAPALPAGDD